jgi:transcriptional regulator with XRE-family HTH domain
MPRLVEPDPFSLKIGRRVRAFRKALQMTQEEVGRGLHDGEESSGSKGHVSNLERGLVRPTVQTLMRIAENMGLSICDLLVFPEEDDRQRLIDRTRTMTKGSIRKILRDAGPAPGVVAKPPRPRKKIRHRASGKTRKAR